MLNTELRLALNPVESEEYPLALHRSLAAICIARILNAPISLRRMLLSLESCSHYRELEGW